MVDASHAVSAVDLSRGTPHVHPGQRAVRCRGHGLGADFGLGAWFSSSHVEYRIANVHTALCGKLGLFLNTRSLWPAIMTHGTFDGRGFGPCGPPRPQGLCHAGSTESRRRGTT